MGRRIIDQWNTKTIGGSGKLSATDMDTVSDGIHIQQSNLENLKLVNLVGQATNTQSQSGPMPGTQYVYDITGISNANQDVHRPDVGQVFQLVAASIITLDGASTMILNLINADGNLVQIDTFNGTSDPMELNEPIYYTNEAWLSCRTSNASSGNARLAVSGIRVR